MDGWSFMKLKVNIYCAMCPHKVHFRTLVIAEFINHEFIKIIKLYVPGIYLVMAGFMKL